MQVRLQAKAGWAASHGPAGVVVVSTEVTPEPVAEGLARDFERASKTSFELASQQLQSGNANVLLLLTAEQNYLQATIQVIQAGASRLSDTAALFQALGGGWWNRPAPLTEKTLDVATNHAEPIADK